MDETIAEGNDSPTVTYSGTKTGIKAEDLGKRLSNDLELTFDSGAWGRQNSLKRFSWR